MSWLGAGCDNMVRAPGDPVLEVAPTEEATSSCEDYEPASGTNPGDARLLSPHEIGGAVRELFGHFGVEGDPVQLPLASRDVRYLFSNSVDVAHLGRTDLERLIGWAEATSAVATSDIPGTLGCAPSGAWDTCLEG
ncbi:MAG: hypothetical protein AAFY60_21395, partial [Myxococcota bacterium]